MILSLLVGAAAGALAGYLGTLTARKLLDRRGRALTCGKRTKTALMAVSVLIGAAGGFLIPLSAESLFMAFMIWLGAAVTLCDLSCRLIPNELVLLEMAAALVFGIPAVLGVPGFPAFSVLSSVLGMIGCFIIFMLPALMSRQVGAGDITLAAAIGLCLGLNDSLLCIVLMGVIVIVYVLAQQSMPLLNMIREMIPLGPFLCAAQCLVLLMRHIPALEGLTRLLSI